MNANATEDPKRLDPATGTGDQTGSIGGLSAGDRDALAVWLLSRVSIWVVVAAAGWLFAEQGQEVVPWLDRWIRWDFFHYRGIAEHGYGGEPTGVPNEAFFPGLPGLLWLGHRLGLSYVVVGLLVSLIAGAVAAVALSRLGELDGGRPVGRLAVLVWVCAPPAVFLAAPYTEALFLGCALPAWLAARRGNWLAAGTLAALACTVRVSGIFLVAAIGVHWLVTRKHERSWSGLTWLFLPVVPLAAWMVYLKQLTGNWLAWLDAQAQEWNREFTWPWDAWANTWRAAFGGTQSPGFAWMFGAEIVATVLGLALTVGLLWWPLWIGIAVFATRRRWVLWVYLMVSMPLMAVWTVTFVTGRWAG